MLASCSGRGSGGLLSGALSAVACVRASASLACAWRAPRRRFGALTSKPYAFTSRPWELKNTESIDVLDGVGSNIRVDTHGAEVRRVLPRLNEAVNEEWLSDKARFAYDGLKRQRLTVPMVRASGERGLVPIDWYKARAVLANRIASMLRAHGERRFEAHAILGPYVDVEAMAALRRTMYRLFPEGTAHVHVQEHAHTAVPPTDLRYAYTASSTLAGLERADVLLLVGTNPRLEAPLFNTRLRKAVLYGGARIGLVGCYADLTYNRNHVVHVGVGAGALRAVAEGRHPFAAELAAAKRPAVVIGQRALQRNDGDAVHKCVERMVRHVPALMPADGSWNGLNVLHAAANTVGALDLGFDETLKGNRWVDQHRSGGASTQPWSRAKVLFLCGADDVDGLEALPRDCFVVYQGHHGDYGASIADLVLPGSAYTEKDGRYVNTEGRVQQGKQAFFAPGQAKPDAEVLDELLIGSGGAAGGFDPEQDIASLAPHLLVRSNGELQPPDVIRSASDGCVQLGMSPTAADEPSALSRVPFGPPVENYYMTEPISRASKTMAKCTRVHRFSNFEQAI